MRADAAHFAEAGQLQSLAGHGDELAITSDTPVLSKFVRSDAERPWLRQFRKREHGRGVLFAKSHRFRGSGLNDRRPGNHLNGGSFRDQLQAVNSAAALALHEQENVILGQSLEVLAAGGAVVDGSGEGRDV
jgi:hypothetical protein